MGLLTRQLVNAIRWATRALTGKTKTLRVEKLRPLVTPECPFVNLPETRKARWDEALTAEKMKKCVWVRPEVEAQTMTRDKAVVDRSAELSSWVDFCYQIMKRGVLIYAYANNHFQAQGPATIAKFLEVWAANGFGKIAGPEPINGSKRFYFRCSYTR